MHLLLRSAAALGLAALLATPLTAQSVDSVTPSEGTTGTLITIEGSGFGSKRPKVELVDTKTGKKAKGSALKVTENSDTTLTVELRKAKTAGAYALRVSPKGADPVEAEGGFTVKAPVLLGGDASGTPGDEIQLMVQYVGNKKPKLSIGGKKAKVLDVSPGDEEGGPVEVLTAAIPKSLANGTWPVELVTKVGSDFADGLVTVTGSTKKIGKSGFEATVNGAALKAKGKGFAVESTGLGIAISANDFGKGSNKQLTLNFPFVPGVTELPITFTGLPNDLALFLYAEGKFAGGVPQITTWQGPFSITLNAFSGGQLAGSFEGDLSSPGESGREVVGSFVLDVD